MSKSTVKLLPAEIRRGFLASVPSHPVTVISFPGEDVAVVVVYPGDIKGITSKNVLPAPPNVVKVIRPSELSKKPSENPFGVDFRKKGKAVRVSSRLLAFAKEYLEVESLLLALVKRQFPISLPDAKKWKRRYEKALAKEKAKTQ